LCRAHATTAQQLVVGAIEAALTDGAAEILQVGTAGRFELAGVAWTRVGTVENPSDLNDEFALVPPADGGSPDAVTILVDTSDQRFEDFRAPSSTTTGAGRGASEDIVAASGVLVASTVVLMLVALIAAAGFVVVARRRLRQLGMLAAIGATERHLRLVMLANGAAVGAFAAVLGAAVGLAAWLIAAPSLEGVVGHRIEAFDVPWWLVVSSMLLSVVSAIGAAWWPARAAARTPIVAALSGRPDRPPSSEPFRRGGRRPRRSGDRLPRARRRPAGALGQRLAHPRRHDRVDRRRAVRQPTGDPGIGQVPRSGSGRGPAGAG